MAAKPGLITSRFPITSVDIAQAAGDIHFEIGPTKSWDPAEIDIKDYREKLQIKQNELKVILDPKKHIPDPIRKEGNWYHISAVQLLPKQDGNYSVYIGSDNACCNGVFLSAELSISQGLKIWPVKYVPIPFNIHGILGDGKQVLLYGSGCSGSGIRRVTLDDMCMHDDVYTTEEVNQDPFKYHNVAYCLLFSPPHKREGKLYISWLDAEGNILSSERNNPNVKKLEVIADSIRKRRTDLKLLNAIEICIDEKLSKLKDGQSICNGIKDAIERSHFLYNYHFPQEVHLRGLGWVVSESSLEVIMENMKKSTQNIEA